MLTYVGPAVFFPECLDISSLTSQNPVISFVLDSSLNVRSNKKLGPVFFFNLESKKGLKGFSYDTNVVVYYLSARN